MKKFSGIIALSCLLSSTAFSTTLSEALVHTYQNNPELVAEREKLKTTDEKMYKAISEFLPKVTYQAKKSNEKQDTGAKDINSIISGQQSKLEDWRNTKSKRSTLVAQQNVFNGGQDLMAVKIAKYYIEAGRADLLSKEQDVLLKAINAYLELIRAKEILDIANENYLAYEKKYEAVKDKLEVGAARKADLATASASRADAATNLTIASGSFSSAQASYLQIIGLEPENIAPPASLTQAPSNQLELINNSLAHNPSLKNINYQKEIADISVISNAAALLPSVDIGGEIGKNWQDTRGSNISQPYTNTKAVYVTLTVPIYQKGVEYSNIRSSRADAARFKYILKNSKAEITQKATQAWNDYEGSLDAVKSAQEAVDAGIIGLAAKQQEYDEGVGTLTELLDIQERLFTYKTKLAKVKEECALSYYKMASLMGKLSARDLGLETKIYNPTENYDKIKIQLIGL